MSLIADYGFVLLILACAFGFFMAWGVGANDVANAMGTSVGSRALTIKQAIIVAMIFEFCGAYLAGGEVTETIKNGIVDAEDYAVWRDIVLFHPWRSFKTGMCSLPSGRVQITGRRRTAWYGPFGLPMGGTRGVRLSR